MSDYLLEVKGLKTYFNHFNKQVPAVNGVDFVVRKGETLGIVGESGCGKSVTAMSILKLLAPEAKIVDGQVLFKGKDLVGLNDRQMTRIRGNEISIIFQEPMTSLNPAYTVGYQIGEAIRTHQKLDKKTTRSRAVEMLKLVGIPDPDKRVDEYPHELSGGMRQRVMIAMALSCNPELLIADEPTTALDVTVQAQILELMKSLKDKFHTSIMMITHDLGVVAEMADYVIVMYAGTVVEYSDVKSLYNKPLHPYTEGLMNSLPKIDDPKDKLEAIPGSVPSLYDLPKGCSFWPRCPYAQEICKQEKPELYEVDQRKVRCFLYSGKIERR
ncbi:ABC transporter ATP-binding protein [Paenibacillus riograndensis]|uniref:Oligopeptide transport ATP-binding protein AppD n=1 Tax=Paenibacillus riograndensis SBR5 TaxID=1073571 RepID=A0A0E4HCX8_9BACL|nr:ABC transporter ATP-binding protein [Paenibacillus riograndensis]CQR56977.1 Oligopeptide transport ATP-binding protein AppD [Paenibacillus riograndensis SBR5]